MILNVTNIVKNNEEYKLFPYQFLLLTFWGLWWPQSWPKKLKIVHNLVFIVVFFLNTFLCTEMIIHVIISANMSNFKLVDAFFISATTTSVYKSLKLSLKREMIRSFILYYFDSEWMNTQDYKEYKIHNEINCKIRSVGIIYSAPMIAIVFFKALLPLFECNAAPLPVNAWYPYSVENTLWFWFTYLHQVILGASTACVHISIDTLFAGLLLKMTGQLNILKHRIRNFKVYEEFNYNLKLYKNKRKRLIMKFVHHHNRILRFGKDLNNKFEDFLIVLVISSLPNICLSVYALSSYSEDVNVQYIAIFFTTSSALLQLFIACWFGNEVTLNCAQIKDAVFEINWTATDQATQKLLIIIMIRSSRPIIFSVNCFMKMNLDSFLAIIKTSYAAFNFLKRSNK